MKYISPLLIFSLFVLFSCNSDDNIGDPGPEDLNFQVSSLDGKSQKGPYLIGSSITIFELNNDFGPTGLSFAEEIVDNLGSFQIDGIELASPYVEMRANGFYFNEVINENSAAPLTLNAISNLTEKLNININILTSLEKKRVEFLIANGADFSEAKSQAIAEVLNVFEINNSNIEEAELLDITQAGENNAILLAVSAILQGYGSVADLSALISSISADIETDGVLNDENICVLLKSNASILRLSEIRANMEAWLTTQGVNGSIANFEKFVNQFIQNSPCESNASILYPEMGKHGANILSDTHTSLPKGSYSMAANLKDGSSLRVKVKGNNWVMEIGQSNTGWDVGDWDPIGYQREFTSNRTGDIDFKITLVNPLPNGPVSDVVIIKVYENESDNATWTKNLKISDVSAAINYPEFGDFGGNVLAGFASVDNPMDGNSYPVSVKALIPSGQNVEVEFIGYVWSIPNPEEGIGWEILSMNGNTLRLRSTSEEADFKLILTPPCDPSQSSELIINVYQNGDSNPSFSFNEQIESELSEGPMFLPGNFGENILELAGATLAPGDYSMLVFAESDFKLVLKGNAWNIPNPMMGYGWTVMPYDNASNSQTFVKVDNDADLLIQLINPSQGQAEIQLEYYVGCASTPTESFSIFVD